MYWNTQSGRSRAARLAGGPREAVREAAEDRSREVVREAADRSRAALLSLSTPVARLCVSRLTTLA